jgi:hypothetical protein
MIDEKSQRHSWNNQKLNPKNKTLHITMKYIHLVLLGHKASHRHTY